MTAHACLIGVGSPHGDDRVGWQVADQIRRRCGEGVQVHNVAAPIDLLNHLEMVDWLGVCDACRGTGETGTWHRWEWPDPTILTSPFAGSHGIGLPTALALAERLGQIPKSVVIWGIEVGQVQLGDEMSPGVTEAVPLVAANIIDQLASISRMR